MSEPRRGFGAACAAGLRAATTEIVCFMDCDGTLDPADLVRVVAPVRDGRADLVLGARRPVTRDAWPTHLRLANRAIAFAAGHHAGLALHDLGPMRAARREALLELGLHDRRSGYPLEMVLRAARRGWRISEVEVAYRRRIGRSKVTGTLAGALRAAADMRRVSRLVAEETA